MSPPISPHWCERICFVLRFDFDSVKQMWVINLTGDGKVETWRDLIQKRVYHLGKSSQKALKHWIQWSMALYQKESKRNYSSRCNNSKRITSLSLKEVFVLCWSVILVKKNMQKHSSVKWYMEVGGIKGWNYEDLYWL